MILLVAAFLLQDPQPLPIQIEGKGFSAKYKGDRGIKDDKRVVFVEDFESDDFRASWMEVKEPSEKMRLVEDRGGKSLEIPSDLDKDTGGHLYRMLSPCLETAHLRFYTWFDPEHTFVHHFVHLMGYNPATLAAGPRGHEAPRGPSASRPASSRGATGDG
jgi:hypothetical protein